MPRKNQTRLRRVEPLDMGSGKTIISNDELFAVIRDAIEEAMATGKSGREEAHKHAAAAVDKLKHGKGKA